MVSCLSPNGATLYSGAELPERLAVATTDGVVTLELSASGAQVRAHSLSGRHVSSLWFEPVHGGLFAASYAGGIYRSDDAGETFRPIGDALADANVYCLAARAGRGGVRLYAGTEPVGLFTSTDYGETWTQLPAIAAMPNRERWTFPGPPHDAHLKNLTFDFVDESTLYACVEQGGLFRSRDGGESFVELESIDQDDDDWYRDVHRLLLDPRDPARLLISGGDGVTGSSDGGATWRRVLPTSFAIGYPDGLVADPLDPDRILVSGASHQPGTWRENHSANAHVARSTDGGASWSLVGGAGLPDPLRANIEALSLARSPTASALYLGTTSGEVFCSEDFGEHFELLVTGLGPISKGGHYRALVATG